jgi:HlyD family secretion protein
MKRRGVRLSLYVFGAIVLVGAGSLTFSAFVKRPKPILPERIVRAERGDIARSVVAVGRVESLSRVEVKSKANGIIKALYINVGDRVHEGETLAELDKENLQASVRQAAAALNGEEANLQSAITSEARARIEAENPDLEFARREFERHRDLLQKGIISQQQADDARKVYEIAQNRHKLLNASVSNAGSQISQARARVAEARAALDRAQEELKNATVVAPISGVVLTRDREVGDAVSSILNLGSAATLILTLGDTSTVYVKGKLDEADIGKIDLGMTARTTVESFPGEMFPGTVTKIAPIGVEKDNVTTFEVRVSLRNPGDRLRVNMSANAEVIIEERKGVLLVPESAVAYDRDHNPFVQVYAPSAADSIRRTSVKVGLSNGQRSEIVDGIREGEEMVLP